jgi:hypothetical protein
MAIMGNGMSELRRPSPARQRGELGDNKQSAALAEAVVDESGRRVRHWSNTLDRAADADGRWRKGIQPASRDDPATPPTVSRRSSTRLQAIERSPFC